MWQNGVSDQGQPRNFDGKYIKSENTYKRPLKLEMHLSKSKGLTSPLVEEGLIEDGHDDFRYFYTSS